MGGGGGGWCQEKTVYFIIGGILLISYREKYLKGARKGGLEEGVGKGGGDGVVVGGLGFCRRRFGHEISFSEEIK